jgi:hypothetical protein
MATPRRSALIRERFNKLVDQTWASIGADDQATSTYNLYRRQTKISTSDLGIPRVPFSLVASAVPCMFIGPHSKSHERFTIKEGGKLSQQMIVVWTTHQDIKVGDDLFLSYDQKHYHVQEVGVDGALRRLLCDSSQATNTISS